MRPSSARALAGLAAWLLATACQRSPATTDGGATEEAALPLEVQVSGCAAFAEGDVCEVAPGAVLRLWLPGADDETPTVTAGPRTVPSTTTRWPDGYTVRIEAPEAATRLAVTARAGGRRAAGTVRLAPAVAVPPAVRTARELRKAGKLEEASAVLASADAVDGGARAAVLSARARLEYQRGRTEAAVSDYREAIALHEVEGRRSLAVDDASALTFLLIERSRMAEARTTIEANAARVGQYPEGRAEVANDEGLLAWGTGDLRTAIRKATDAAGQFARLGVEHWRRASTLTLGLRLQELGRYEESIALFRSLLADTDAGACERGDLLDDVGWGALLAVEAGTPAAGVDAGESIHQALDLFRSACADPNRMANALENLALSELQNGRADAAQGALDDARRTQRDPPVSVALYAHHLAGRIALARGQPAAALGSFVREEGMAAAVGNVNDRLSVADAKAQALVALGRSRDALAALDASDAFLDALAGSVPLGEGMDGFFSTRDRVALRRIDLLVRAGRVDDALVAARRWQSRVVEGLRLTTGLEGLDGAARARWQDAVGAYRVLREATDVEAAHEWEMPADQLARARARRDEVELRARALLDDALAVLPPARTAAGLRALTAGEVELMILPAAPGALVLARSRAGVTAIRAPSFDVHAGPDAIARALLDPLEAQVARARVLRVMPYGEARGVDLQALPWHGAPLLEHAVVEYTLGLDGDYAAPPGGEALVVTDPSGNLANAGAEADVVQHALADSGAWRVDDVRGQAATAERIRAGLGSADLFHYAGHATFGGADGLGSALSLANGGRLTPGDVLTLPRVPRSVVLLGCETGRESTTGRMGGLGLAHAFLVSGAGLVVATSRPVDDALARDLATELYTRIAGAPSPDLATALRDAQLAIRMRAPAADWAAFRALVR